MKWIDEKRAALRVYLRERKERAEEKKAAKETAPPVHGAPLAWCILLTLVGVAALSGSTWMLLIFIAGSVGHIDWYWNYAADQTGVTANAWRYESEIHLLVAIGLFLFCLAIAIFNATWLEARKHLFGVIKNVVTCIGVAVGLFMISGAIVVQQRGTDARARDEVTAAQTAQVGVAEQQGRLAYAQQRLREMRANPNAYMAQAASVGAAEWEHTYIAQARATNDPRLPMIERALGAARAADAQEAEIARLTAQVAGAQVQTVQAEAVTVRAQGFMAPVVSVLEDARKPITAVLGELLALTAFGFALAAWASRRREGYGSIPQHRFMLDDMSKEDAPRYMSPEQVKERTTPLDSGYKGDTICDEQGNELQWVEGFVRPKDGKWIPGHYRKSGRKQKREIEVTVNGNTFTAGEVEEDKPVSEDGGGRIASVAPQSPNLAQGPEGAGEQESGSDEPDTPKREQVEPVQPADDSVIQSVSPSEPSLDFTQEEQDEMARMELAESVAPEHASEPVSEQLDRVEEEQPHDEADNETTSVDHLEPPTDTLPQEREPETNPARLLAAAK